jgi:hypothetical protein
LRIKVFRNKNDIFLSQRRYILDLLTEVRMLECKPADILMIQNLKLDVDTNQSPTNKETYQKFVEKNNLSISHYYTRPDIAYAVSDVSQFMYAQVKSTWRLF